LTNHESTRVRVATTVNGADVAIVHDYLNQRGGAERVVLELARMWPSAPVYTSLYRPDSTFDWFAQRNIRVTPLDRLPVDQGFRALFPLYPAAFRSLGTLDANLVISSSSGWAHSVRTAGDTFHVVYCHTPARWLYGAQYMNGSAGERAVRPFLSAYRRWDRRAAARADLYIANSREVQARIRSVYGFAEAPVVSPPVDVGRFTPRERGDRLLVISRLLPYKRIDLAVAAATRLGLGLDVVGSGPALADLQRIAGPTVTFHGRVDEAAVRHFCETCFALILPGHEDFGITPVEAQAAGKPVIAYRSGGALETVEDGVSGVFFDEPTVESVVDAVQRSTQLQTTPAALAARAWHFSAEAFRERLRTVITEAMTRA
jgi:glycosyltransferase involved in cell wall biosynthesis